MDLTPIAPTNEAEQPTAGHGPRLRRPISGWASVFFAALSIVLVFLLWSLLTADRNTRIIGPLVRLLADEKEKRIVSPLTLQSPRETFATFRSLWFDRELTRNTAVTLRRVSLGFALAIVVGVPLGIMAGCYSWIRAFLAPAVIFGRNIPLAALIPLLFLFFGIRERQKVMFIFIACVAFVIADVAVAISEISQRYLDTAYTLGAKSWQAIMKVLVPLAMPSVFDSARLLFGLAFGYIMLAESIRYGNETGGLGNLINVAQHRGPRAHIYLIILIIPIVALAIDRLLYWIQVQLFPYRYGSYGLLNRALRAVLGWWDDLKSLVWKPKPPFDQLTVAVATPTVAKQDEPT